MMVCKGLEELGLAEEKPITSQSTKMFIYCIYKYIYKLHQNISARKSVIKYLYSISKCIGLYWPDPWRNISLSYTDV